MEAVKKPEISVLMSCYNGGRWLRQAVESVLSQTFADFEFIIVDDGSSDDTCGIIREYAGKDRRIIPLFKKNTGLADSLNAGLVVAAGAWIARMDQDDVCEPDRLAEQLAYVRSRPRTVMVGSAFWEIGEDGLPLKANYYPTSHRVLVRNLERLLRFFPHSSAFYSTAVARDCGGYNTRIHRSEDWRFWLELSTRGELGCIRRPLLRIRKHPGQMSLDENGRRQLCDALAGAVCYFLKKKGGKDPSSRDYDDAQWADFSAWVQAEAQKAGYVAQHEAWGTARAAYFSGPRPGAPFRFLTKLLRSGYAWTLIKHKFAGSPLAESLAVKWAEREAAGEPG